MARGATDVADRAVRAVGARAAVVIAGRGHGAGADVAVAGLVGAPPAVAVTIVGNAVAVVVRTTGIDFCFGNELLARPGDDLPNAVLRHRALFARRVGVVVQDRTVPADGEHLTVDPMLVEAIAVLDAPDGGEVLDGA